MMMRKMDSYGRWVRRMRRKYLRMALLQVLAALALIVASVFAHRRGDLVIGDCLVLAAVGVMVCACYVGRQWTRW